MNPSRLIAVLLCALSSLPVYAAAQELKEVEELRWVERADAIADAKAAIERKNFALLGIHGYTWLIPGVRESQRSIEKNMA
jgi:hypothetical protein